MKAALPSRLWGSGWSLAISYRRTAGLNRLSKCLAYGDDAWMLLRARATGRHDGPRMRGIHPTQVKCRLTLEPEQIWQECNCVTTGDEFCLNQYVAGLVYDAGLEPGPSAHGHCPLATWTAGEFHHPRMV